ncbi:hypothetical protein [Lederbergia lenta]|nr:hypothetical protein [Lederbergia lenta]MCM3110457.1 hypothetical protein [Lederbergia lenta]MEC2323977.1 hypothetical protein [Lederbergia lenta]
MLFTSIIFLIGFGLTVSGGVSIIAYLNLLTTGHSFYDFASFIFYRPECYLLPIGIILMAVAIYNSDPK